MKIDFKTFKPRTTSTAQKLSLDKDEQARVCFIEEDPRLAYIHSFEKVVVGDDGNPIEVTDQWPDGTERKVTKTKYDGKLRCLGDAETVQTYGADPDNCEACRAHIGNPNAVKAPTARILGHVIKYNTKPGSFTASKPFAATLLVWDLTAKRFESLQDIYNEHGDLSKKDLMLGPCENKQMQKFTIQPGSGDAYYLSDPSFSEYVAELLKEGVTEDLESVAGKLPTPFEMETKVKEIVRAYNHAFGISTGNSNYQSLLAPAKASQVAEAADVAESSPPASPVSPVSQASAESPASPESPVEVKEKDSTKSLEDLLANIGRG